MTPDGREIITVLRADSPYFDCIAPVDMVFHSGYLHYARFENLTPTFEIKFNKPHVVEIW